MTDEKCFIAMPVATRKEHEDIYGDPQHWRHVMETLFVPAIEAAGMEPVLPSADGSEMIHGRIIENLSESAMVLCDLSSHNPNVFFELGVRTSMNLPVALVKDEQTTIPFDTSGINTWQYASSLKAWDIPKEIEALSEFLKKSVASCAGQNPLWRHFGLTIRANEPSSDESPTDARIDLLTAKVEELQHRLPPPLDQEADYDTAVERLASQRVDFARRESRNRLIADVYRIPGLTEHVQEIKPGNWGGVEIHIISPFPKRLHDQIRDLATEAGVTVTFSQG